MENKIGKQRLGRVVALLEGRSMPDKKTLVQAKQNLLAQDPGFEISNELKFINRGELREALISFVSRNLLVPFLAKIFIK